MKFIDYLGLMFIGLKLANVITWSWLWVLSPYWIVLILTIILRLMDNKEKRDYLKRINRHR